MTKGIYIYNDIKNEVNSTIMKATKKILLLNKSHFTMMPDMVQNAHIGKTNFVDLNYIYIDSEKRFKLYTEKTDLVFIESGNGFIKWSRGEKIFSAGDILIFNEVKEYELNGKCVFIVFKN